MLKILQEMYKLDFSVISHEVDTRYSIFTMKIRPQPLLR